jgi:CheY-like chemotaxis protein
LMLRPTGKGSESASKLTVEQRENLDIINRSGEHLLGLINDVLEMSKIEAGRTSLNEHGFDLYRMLESMEDLFRLRAKDQGLELKLICGENLPRYIRADEGKLRQILLNLLGNAVKFTERGGIELRVKRIADRHTLSDESSIDKGYFSMPYLQIDIADTGPGIPASELESIFDPFVQSVSGHKAQEGTGLGLSISKQYVELMGGKLIVNSELGQGSTFTLYLPYESIGVTELEIRPQSLRVVGIEPGQPVYRLLIVDDKEMNRMLLNKLFTDLGFEVREAENGLIALDIWKKWEPHLIWMDMRMPVMDGYEATRRIKATTKGQATVIVALTASALEEDKAIILSEGCDAYIRKPFREDELFNALTKFLGVQFIYEDGVADYNVDAEAMHLDDFVGETGLNLDRTVTKLAFIPTEYIKTLVQATHLGYYELIIDSIDQIALKDQELARVLKELADNFEHEKILLLIKELEKRYE